MAALATLVTLSALAGPAAAQTRQSLFDGKSLTGWHTQGVGIWSVSQGAIQARNPTKDWAHLIADQSHKNGHVRVRFFNRAGNSGLYVRGSAGGIYGFQGMQVDIGAPHKDGSVMRVTDSTYAWYAEITRALDSGYLKAAAWNELSVDMQGNDLKTYINGKLIWSGTQVAGIAATGVLALQLHSGDDNDISFKDIDLFTPVRISYCPIPGDPAYRIGNDPDSALCRPVTLVIPARRLPAIRAYRAHRAHRANTAHAAHASGRAWISNAVFDLRGARLPAFPSPTPDKDSRP